MMYSSGYQQPASDGTRSRKGCLTCRIRKKKCDEQRPSCRACRSRQLACYGFDTPPPAWSTGKASWQEVRDCQEAKSLRTLAELRYRASRKLGSRGVPTKVAALETQGFEADDRHMQPYHPLRADRIRPIDNFVTPSVVFLTAGVNIWQSRSETLWWDSKMRSLQPGSDTNSQEETRLLMLFVDVIHPIAYTFYKLDHNADRSWMLDRIISSESLYCSALSISACFEHSLTQPPRINEIGICPKVRRLQTQAILRLRDEVDRFAKMRPTPLEDFVWAGTHLLDVIVHLETLEIFSMLQGQWEMHHHAARRVLNHIETCVAAKYMGSPLPTSAIAATLARLPSHDARRRSLEFSILSFVWIDVLAISTFGVSSFGPCAFDYLELIDAGNIRPQEIMGCQGWVVAVVARIARLEQWKVMHQSQVDAATFEAELKQRRRQLVGELDSGIALLERDLTHAAANDLDEDIRLVTMIWAHGARVLHQVTTSQIEPEQVQIDQTFVNSCLEKLEALPGRLVMRITFPYTIAGSMASSKPQQDRFRWILGRTMHDAHPPGISWKGLLIMEECWRLRRLQPERFIGWREAMESLGARVLLT